MAETSVALAGNLTDDPQLRYTPQGTAKATFQVAVTGRVGDGDGWKDAGTAFYRVVVWRTKAEHAADSLAKGSRVVVMGRLAQRSWQADDGSTRSVVEVVAEELGPRSWGRACGGRPPRRAGQPSRPDRYLTPAVDALVRRSTGSHTDPLLHDRRRGGDPMDPLLFAIIVVAVVMGPVVLALVLWANPDRRPWRRQAENVGDTNQEHARRPSWRAWLYMGGGHGPGGVGGGGHSGGGGGLG